MRGSRLTTGDTAWASPPQPGLLPAPRVPMPSHLLVITTPCALYPLPKGLPSSHSVSVSDRTAWARERWRGRVWGLPPEAWRGGQGFRSSPELDSGLPLPARPSSPTLAGPWAPHLCTAMPGSWASRGPRTRTSISSPIRASLRATRLLWRRQGWAGVVPGSPHLAWAAPLSDAVSQERLHRPPSQPGAHGAG